MSIAAVNWALSFAPVECAQEHIILIALADRADDDGRCAWPGQEWLAQRGRCSTRTVRRHLKALESRGLIVRGDQRHVEHIRRDARPIVWDLDITQIQVPVGPKRLPESDLGERPDNLSAPTPNGRADNMSGRSPSAERPDTDVLTDRTLLSYKPSLEPSLTVRCIEPAHEATDLAPITTNDAAAAAELDRLRKDLESEFSEKVAAVEQTLIAMHLDSLENGCRIAGLTAAFHKLTAEHRAEISELVAQHGVPALVKSAQRQHRADSPARFVQAWLPVWRELPAARPATATVTISSLTECPDCDEYGWVLGDDRRPIEPARRCTHNRAAA